MPKAFGGSIASAIKNTEQANLTLAFPAISRIDERVPALGVLSCALGGGMSSKLFQEVREKLGLVYSIYTYSSAYEEAGSLCLYFGTNPKNINKALTAIRKCIRSVVKSGFTEYEFRRARQQLKGGLVMGQESSLAIMKAMGRNAMFFNEPFSIDERLHAIESLTLDDVNHLLPLIFDSKEIGVGYVGKKPTCDLTKIFR